MGSTHCKWLPQCSRITLSMSVLCWKHRAGIGTINPFKTQTVLNSLLLCHKACYCSNPGSMLTSKDQTGLPCHHGLLSRGYFCKNQQTYRQHQCHISTHLLVYFSPFLANLAHIVYGPQKSGKLLLTLQNQGKNSLIF